MGATAKESVFFQCVSIKQDWNIEMQPMLVILKNLSAKIEIADQTF